MITLEQVDTLYGNEMYDRDGDKIGKVGQIWDDGTGNPAWASVRTGLFGINESLVPLQDAGIQNDRLVVPFQKAMVKDAPNVDASHDEPLTQQDVDRLYEYYGMKWQDSGTGGDSSFDDSRGSALDTPRGTPSDASFDTARDMTFDSSRDSSQDSSRDSSRNASFATSQDSSSGGDSMTRSEERLNVGTQREQTGRARLRKYVVTENQQVTVPVQREQVRLDREPVTDANRDDAFDGQEITEAEHEVTLHAERPVVNTETVPVERVRLGKETVTENQTVGGEVRKERIDADLPDDQERRSFE